MIIDLARELKNKTMEHERDEDINCNWFAWNDPQKFGKSARRFRDERMSRDHPTNSIAKVGQNIEKNAGDFGETNCPTDSIKKPSANSVVKKLQIIIT